VCVWFRWTLYRSPVYTVLGALYHFVQEMRLHSREEIQRWLEERSAELQALLQGEPAQLVLEFGKP
jgi:hypothetical protein